MDDTLNIVSFIRNLENIFSSASLFFVILKIKKTLKDWNSFLLC